MPHPKPLQNAVLAFLETNNNKQYTAGALAAEMDRHADDITRVCLALIAKKQIKQTEVEIGKITAYAFSCIDSLDDRVTMVRAYKPIAIPREKPRAQKHWRIASQGSTIRVRSEA